MEINPWDCKPMWAMRGCPITNGNASDDSAMAGIRKAIIPPWKLRY
jgi:hypothetical protein